MDRFDILNNKGVYLIMKFLKKRKTILLTIVLGVTFLLVFSQAAFAEGEVKLSASDVKGEVGEEVTVEIRAEDALDHEGGQFDLSFDSDIVEPVSASRGALVPDVSGNLFDYNLELADGELRLIWVIAEGCEDDSGVIGTINFEVLDDGETDLDFSNIVMSPDGFEATATSGSVESEDPLDAKEQAIKDADEAIAALPDVDDITLVDRVDVEDARELVDIAMDDHGAVEEDFENLDKLLDAEARIDKLEAIETADDAILALPSVDVLTLDDRPDVVAARALVDKAKDDHGAEDEDFVYLSRLEAAEGRIRELEGLEPTPPTGAINYMLPVGLMVIFAGLLAYFRRSQLATK